MTNDTSPTGNAGTTAHCDRAAFIIDAQDYFRAFVESVRKAERSVLIIGWDIDSRIKLLRDNGQHLTLSELLNEVADKRPDLHLHILVWSYPLAYSMDREPLQELSFERKTRNNVHFHLDDEFPLGSSHHQKVVVVDDKIAFVGGIDLAGTRWDTSEHLPDDDRRRAPTGDPYIPFHDTQMVVEGDIAVKIGEMARDRWFWATGDRIAGPEATDSDPWPPSVTPDMRDTEAVMALTLPHYKQRSGVRQVEAMYSREIGAAKSHIYIENQYFTSEPIQELLASRLREPDGPEVFIILSPTISGLIERLVMEPLQSVVIDKLHEADEHGRLGIYSPFADKSGEVPIKVHAKLMIVDDKFATVGSANLNGRSMGLDSECNLAVHESEGDGAITTFRHRLLAHHLGIETQEVREEETSRKSMLQALEHLRTKYGRLIPEKETRTEASLLVDPELAQPLDPTSPGALDDIMDDYSGKQNSERSYSGFLALGIVLIAFIALALAWRFTPLSKYANATTLLHWAGEIRHMPLAPLVVVAAFVGGGMLLFPVTVMVVLTASIFGPLTALGTSMAGCLASAMVVYLIGRILGHEAVTKVAGTRINTISKQLGRHGILSVAIIRNVPIAPYTIINLVAGASHISLRNFLIGTFLGMGPGIIAMTLFGGQLIRVLKNPGPMTVGILVVVVLAVAGIGFLLRKRLRSIQGRDDGDKTDVKENGDAA